MRSEQISSPRFDHAHARPFPGGLPRAGAVVSACSALDRSPHAKLIQAPKFHCHHAVRSLPVLTRLLRPQGVIMAALNGFDGHHYATLSPPVTWLPENSRTCPLGVHCVSVLQSCVVLVGFVGRANCRLHSAVFRAGTVPVYIRLGKARNRSS